MRLLLLFFIILIVSVFSFNLEEKCDESPLISLTFDDGLISQYEMAYDSMTEYGMAGTIFIVPGRAHFEGHELINQEQLNEMYLSGWEIGSHSLTHADLTNSLIDLDFELKQSKKELNQFNPIGISIPYGKYNTVVKSKAKQHYNYARPSTWGYNDLNNFDEYNLSSIWINSKWDDDSLAQIINHTIENKTWTIIAVHDITSGPGDDYSINEIVFDNFIKKILDSQIEVKTIKEVLECRR